MVPGRRAGFWRLALLGLPLVVLSACPQLLKDDFYGLIGAPAAPTTPAPDASVPSGGNAGAGGSLNTPSESDAGPAGPAPFTDVQVALRSALVHRYRFDSGAPLLDSVGGAHAVAVGATFSEGAAVLAGTGSGQYIDLPNGLLSGLRNASFEIWLIWDVRDPTESTSSWQRIFDLGSNPSTVEGQQCELENDATALFLTPRSNGTNGKLSFKCESCGETRIEAPSLPVGVQVQVLGVVDEDAQRLSLYRDGALLAALPFSGSLSQISQCAGRAAPCDWNNWLGRSQHVEDPPFAGRILDFRVYAAALSAAQVRASFAAGPDAGG